MRLVWFPLLLLLFFCGVVSSTSSSVEDGEEDDEPKSVSAQIQALEQQAATEGFDSPDYPQTLAKILQLNPRHTQAMLQLGFLDLTSNDPIQQLKGAIMVEKCFSKDRVDGVVENPQRLYLSMALARFRWERREYDKAYQFLKLAEEASDDMELPNPCVEVSLATLLHPFPNTTQQAQDSLKRYTNTAAKFLQKYKTKPPKWDEAHFGERVAGFGDDPYVHCVLSIFHLSFYHFADVAKAARLHAHVATRVWPQLLYTSPNVPAKAPTEKSCTTRKIELGIVSGILTPHSPVSDDFGGVLSRLDRTKFNITYIYLAPRDRDTTVDEFVHQHPEDQVMVWHQTSDDMHDGAWIARYYPEVERLNLDILLYLDLTMSSEVTRLAMARLAPVQATTHGHPVTSGVPAVDYYISWGAAELPTAQEHYSEQLMLLNDTVLHQYYQERHNGTHSRVNGGNFQELKKRQTFNSIPPGGHWYTCMQKPHKLMPEMDPLICGILEKDPEGRVILHHPSTQSMLRSLKKRLKAAGCKLSRVHFLPEQPHHALLALYAVSTVVLDSYPAGGCTTTREALEMGAPVVTLPGRLLGGRWTYAYYKMLGDEKLMNQVVASTPAEYITKAVELGVNTAARAQVQARINMRLHKLYRKQEAVDSWERVLLQIAPVELQEKCT